MIETHPTPKVSQIALPFGITFGAIMILAFMVSYAFDIDPIENKWVGIIMNLMNYLILPVIFISLALNKFKKENLGYITLSQGLKNGVLITLFAAVVYGIFYTIFVTIFPEFITEALDKTREIMIDQNANLTTEQIDLAISISEKFMKPYLAVPITLAMYSFIGLIYGLIIGAIVQKKQDNFVA